MLVQRFAVYLVVAVICSSACGGSSASQRRTPAAGQNVILATVLAARSLRTPLPVLPTLIDPRDLAATFQAGISTPVTPQSDSEPAPGVTATILIDYSYTESQLGWRLLRQKNERFQSSTRDADVETFADIGLSRVRVAYADGNGPRYVVLFQEPLSYLRPIAGLGDDYQQDAGAFVVSFKPMNDGCRAVFVTGEAVEDEPVVAEAVSGGLSCDDVRRFIETLAFDSDGDP